MGMKEKDTKQTPASSSENGGVRTQTVEHTTATEAPTSPGEPQERGELRSLSYAPLSACGRLHSLMTTPEFAWCPFPSCPFSRFPRSLMSAFTALCISSRAKPRRGGVEGTWVFQHLKSCFFNHKIRLTAPSR